MNLNSKISNENLISCITDNIENYKYCEICANRV